MQTEVGVGMSRRHVLLAIGAAGVAGVAAATTGLRRWGSSLASGAPPGMAGVAGTAGGAASGELTLSRFAPHVGSRFTASEGTGLWLEEATAQQASPADRPGLRGEAFSLLFRSRGGAAMGDGIHTVSHPALGPVPLFLVAVGTGRSGQGYQAVVDRRSPHS